VNYWSLCFKRRRIQTERRL